MSYAMAQAGFDTYDVHMSDLQAGRARLALPGPGGLRRLQLRRHAGRGRGLGAFDPVQPGAGRAVRRLLQPRRQLRLGVCNGCQMLAALSPIIPGAQDWPRFTRNRSEQFEARLSLVEVLDSPACSSAAWPAAAADRRGAWRGLCRLLAARRRRPVQRAMRFVDHHGQPTEAYPFNPNGSPGGLTAVTTADGRFTALMPHPERVFRNVQMSWTPGRRRRPAPGCACSATRGSPPRRLCMQLQVAQALRVLRRELLQYPVVDIDAVAEVAHRLRRVQAGDDRSRGRGWMRRCR
jgi:phosphoribosylformylglycinamidine synthase